MPKKDSKKRTKPPSTSPSPSAVTPKKLKSNKQHETESLRNALEIVETKLQGLHPTPGNDEHFTKTSDGPQPGPNSNDNIPPWAQELWSMLNSVKEDIAMVREDILVLHSRIPRRLDTTQHQPSKHNEAMDIELPQIKLKSPNIRENIYQIRQEN